MSAKDHIMDTEADNDIKAWTLVDEPAHTSDASKESVSDTSEPSKETMSLPASTSHKTNDANPLNKVMAESVSLPLDLEASLSDDDLPMRFNTTALNSLDSMDLGGNQQQSSDSKKLRAIDLRESLFNFSEHHLEDPALDVPVTPPDSSATYGGFDTFQLRGSGREPLSRPDETPPAQLQDEAVSGPSLKRTRDLEDKRLMELQMEHLRRQEQAHSEYDSRGVRDNDKEGSEQGQIDATILCRESPPPGQSNQDGKKSPSTPNKNAESQKKPSCPKCADQDKLSSNQFLDHEVRMAEAMRACWAKSPTDASVTGTLTKKDLKKSPYEIMTARVRKLALPAGLTSVREPRKDHSSFEGNFKRVEGAWTVKDSVPSYSAGMVYRPRNEVDLVKSAAVLERIRRRASSPSRIDKSPFDDLKPVSDFKHAIDMKIKHSRQAQTSTKDSELGRVSNRTFRRHDRAGEVPTYSSKTFGDAMEYQWKPTSEILHSRMRPQGKQEPAKAEVNNTSTKAAKPQSMEHSMKLLKSRLPEDCMSGPAKRQFLSCLYMLFPVEFPDIHFVIYRQGKDNMSGAQAVVDGGNGKIRCLLRGSEVFSEHVDGSIEEGDRDMRYVYLAHEAERDCSQDQHRKLSDFTIMTLPLEPLKTETVKTSLSTAFTKDRNLKSVVLKIALQLVAPSEMPSPLIRVWRLPYERRQTASANVTSETVLVPAVCPKREVVK